MDVTTVGKHLSVGSDPPPDATSAYDLVVLVSAQHQHVGERFPTAVLRAGLPDLDAEPTREGVKRAQAVAERVAYEIAPFCIPWPIFNQFSPQPAGTVPTSKDPEPMREKNVLVTCEEGMNRSLWVAGMALVLAGEQATGKEARLYLEKLRGPNAFESRGMRDALDRYYPAEFAAFRAPPIGQSRVVRGGFAVR